MSASRFELIVGTDHIMARLSESIVHAKKSISLQFFTFEGDSVGLHIAALLKQKAQEGVPVRVLCDDFSNWKINDKWLFTGHKPSVFFSLLREWYQTQKMRMLMQFNGISLKLTNPLNFFKLRASLSSRDHRKLVIIDEKVAFTGGYNLSEHNYSWHDTFTEIHDPLIVSVLAEQFNDTFENKALSSTPTVVGDSSLYYSTPTLMKQVFQLVTDAKQKVFIESPYFSDQALLTLLLEKKKQGLQVAIIIPKKNNIRYMSRIHRKYLRRYPELFTCRVLPTKMLHAKHMVIDGYSIFGSSNFLSSKLIDNHVELSVLTTDKSYNKQLTEYFNFSLAHECE